MAILKTDAIVLKRFGFGNTSQIAHLMTRDFGKISLLAKGVHSTKKKEREVFDLLCNYGIVFHKKKHSHLHLVRQLRTRNHFPGIRNHLEKTYAALYLAELIDSGTKEEEPNPALFDLLLSGLLFLDTLAGDDWKSFLLAFELKFLKIIGYLPEIHFCLGCGVSLEPPAEVFFSREKGGILCKACKSSAMEAISLNWGNLSILRSLCKANNVSLSRIRLLAPQAKVLRRIMTNYISHVLEKKLKLSKYLLD